MTLLAKAVVLCVVHSVVVATSSSNGRFTQRVCQFTCIEPRVSRHQHSSSYRHLIY